MTLSNRMRIAREAMDLFIRSLPPGCAFSIISFGSSFDSLVHGDGDVLICQDESRNFAIEQIKTFECNYGGTEIL